MRVIIRWLASDEIALAHMRGYLAGFRGCASSIRRTAAKEGPGREIARDVLLAAADGIDDAIAAAKEAGV
jgi:hypothetical protein